MRKEAACIALLGVLWWGAGSAHAAPAVLAHWRFDEGAGQAAADAGGQGNDGRLGAPVAGDASDPAWVGGHDGAARWPSAARTTSRFPIPPPWSPRTSLSTRGCAVRAPPAPGATSYPRARWTATAVRTACIRTGPAACPSTSRTGRRTSSLRKSLPPRCGTGTGGSYDGALDRRGPCGERPR